MYVYSLARLFLRWNSNQMVLQVDLEDKRVEGRDSIIEVIIIGMKSSTSLHPNFSQKCYKSGYH